MHSQVSSYKPSGCIEQLHAFSRGWPHGSYPKPRAPVKHMNEPRWRTVGSSSQPETTEQGRLQLLQSLSFILSLSVWNNLGNHLWSHWVFQASWSFFSHTRTNIISSWSKKKPHTQSYGLNSLLGLIQTGILQHFLMWHITVDTSQQHLDQLPLP